MAFCRLLTRVLATTLAVLFVAQIVFDLRAATFGVADSGLIVRLGVVAGGVVFLLLSSRFVVAANWVLGPLGLRIPTTTDSASSQGLSLPAHWFDKIAPVGTQRKNPAVIQPDPRWNAVSKHQS